MVLLSKKTHHLLCIYYLCDVILFPILYQLLETTWEKKKIYIHLNVYNLCDIFLIKFLSLDKSRALRNMPFSQTSFQIDMLQKSLLIAALSSAASKLLRFYNSHRDSIKDLKEVQAGVIYYWSFSQRR